ncbi:MAG: sulfur oxidation c-type cytochrome SoxX [Burkholderiaceae bacterium]|jgi:sulfur-oxidizing protein SoxX
MNKKIVLSAVASAVVLAGCAGSYSSAELDKMTKEIVAKSFSEKGIAKLDRLNQDDINLACTQAELSGKDLDAATRKRVEEVNMKTIKFPADGKFIGDWKSGEKIAQGGRGMTYSDKAGSPNGGNCYNCHQISKAEISYGTLGPSLYQYGKLRGDGDAVVKYTWGKLYNAKAYNACTNMPRFGHAGILTEAQMKDLMALLLDPASPVNQ